MTTIIVFDTHTIRIFVWITPKIMTEKWNLAVNFNCLEAINFYAPNALAVRRWSI